jgi:heterodisulfide reductase subunit A
MGISVILCRCGGVLNKKINFNVLAEAAEKVEEVTAVKSISSLCDEEGIKILEEHLKEAKPSSLVVAGCSKRLLNNFLTRTLTAAGFNLQCVEAANILGHCLQVHDEPDEVLTSKAERMLLVAIEKAKSLQPIEAKRFKVKEQALVIGGGIAGIQAALDLAYQGFKVYLVERSPTIGGVMALLVKTFPTDDCAICIEGPKMAEVAAHPNVETITYAEVEEVKRTAEGFKVKIVKKPRYVDPAKCTGCGLCVEKCPIKVPNEWDGKLGVRKAIYIPFPQALPRKATIDKDNCLYFTKGVCEVCKKFCPAEAVDFEQKPETLEVEVGAIIAAVGFSEFDASKDPKYGFGKIKDVITQLQLARLLDASGPTGGKLKRPSDSAKPKRIVMVQCVGSRDPETNPYCSRYCCMAAIKNATLIKIEQDPEAEITILYKDVRAAGKGFEEYYVRAQERFGVKFVKGDLVKVSENPERKEVNVEYLDEKGEKKILSADLVVLSTGMVPSEGLKELAEKLGIEVDEYGFLKELDDKVGTVETIVPGIYVCGCAQGPKDIPESVAQASAAAALAALHMKGFVEKTVSIPVYDEELCGKCGICRLVCPFNAITIDEEAGVRIDEMLCQGCGLCVSSCPTKALRLPNNDYDVIRSQINVALQNLEKAPKPFVLALCCEECAYTTMDSAGFTRRKYPVNVFPIFVPCLSSVSVRHVVEALTSGADGVVLVGCPENRCHYKSGLDRVDSQLDKLKPILEGLGVPGKVRVIKVAGSMVENLAETVSEFVESLGGKKG